MQQTQTISFNDLGLSPSMVAALAKKGFESPSSIQALVIPEFLKEQSNIIGQAQTGTGKTAAFGIPIIETLVPERGVTKALILTPTRELAVQVSDEIYSLIGDKRLRVLPVYGGQSIDQQINNIRRGVDIIVGTPGRVMDLLERKVLNIANLDFFVLDEADEMLNMGFVDDIESILKQTNEEKKMLFFSATMPASILKIAKKYMHTYKILTVEAATATTNLTEQIYFEVRESDKFDTLCRVLDFERDFYGIIFARTKHETDHITEHLKARGYMADAIHGDVTQSLRNKTLASFKAKRISILVATDVAARGIDVNNLTHVINYSIPNEAEAYVHRIGRTGRAGNKGIAITFVTPKEAYQLTRIQRMTKTSIKRQKAPSIKEVLTAKREALDAFISVIINENDHKDYTDIAQSLLAKQEPEALVAAILRHAYGDEFLAQSYSVINEFSSDRGGRDDRGGDRRDGLRGRDDRDSRGGDRDSRGSRGGDRGRSDSHGEGYQDRDQSRGSFDDQTKLFVALGKRDGMDPRSLLELLHTKAKTPARKVRDIRILDNFSFITVPFDEAEIIMRTINKGDGERPLITKAKN
jgi:ATP-dependent RNA helicase DeaD